MPNFDFYNVACYRDKSKGRLVIRGEVKNNSGRNWGVVAVRVILFNKSMPMLNTLIVVNGVLDGRTKSFEKYLEEADYDSIAAKITRIEVIVDSSF